MNIEIEDKEERKEFDKMITANLGSLGRVEIDIISNCIMEINFIF